MEEDSQIQKDTGTDTQLEREGEGDKDRKRQRENYVKTEDTAMRGSSFKAKLLRIYQHRPKLFLPRFLDLENLIFRHFGPMLALLP